MKSLMSCLYSSSTASTRTDRLNSYTPSQATLTAIYMDQNIVTRSATTLAITQQIIGFNDEVIDIAFLSLPSTSEIPSAETHLAVATNSDLIRVYNLQQFNTSLLAGHKDVVLCLDKSPNGERLISGSKDKTARIWSADSNSGEWNCIGICEGHVESVGAVVHSKKVENGNDEFLVTGSQDRTIKVWDLSTLSSTDPPTTETTPIQSLRSLTTLKIHEKDINSLAIAPNNKLLASGSQDRTAKLFSLTCLPKTKKVGSTATAVVKLLGTFNGHKRGIWSVKFSTVDQCLITGSGDRTIKLWNLGDFSCIKVSSFFYLFEERRGEGADVVVVDF